MGSKRFIVFGNPPTLQQLRSSSISSRDTPTWQTRTVYHSTSQAHHQSAAKKRSCTTEPLEAKSRQERSSDPGHRHPSSASQPSAVLPNLASVSVVAGHSQHPGDITTSSESLDHSQGSRKRPKLQWQEEHDEVDTDQDVSEVDLRGNGDDAADTNSDSMDYYQSQLDYRDSFDEVSGDVSLLTPTPGNRTSCLLSNPQQELANDPSPASGATRPPSQQQSHSYSESMVVNPPQWHFDSRSCTPLDQLENYPKTPYSILFYLSDKKPLSTIELKKPRKDGSSTVDIAHFECMDDSGSSLKLVLWDDVAELLDRACLVGDIIYLSGIAISTYQGKPQASSTFGTRAQICYRLRPTHASHLHLYCPDMRLAYDPTTRRVGQLLDWAKSAFF